MKNELGAAGGIQESVVVLYVYSTRKRTSGFEGVCVCVFVSVVFVERESRKRNAPNTHKKEDTNTINTIIRAKAFHGIEAESGRRRRRSHQIFSSLSTTPLRTGN